MDGPPGTDSKTEYSDIDNFMPAAAGKVSRALHW